MAKPTKFIVAGDCWGRDGKVHGIGEYLELDLDAKKDCEFIALMSHSGRLAPATAENVKVIEEEARKQKKSEKEFAATMQSFNAPQKIAELEGRIAELEQLVARKK